MLNLRTRVSALEGRAGSEFDAARLHRESRERENRRVELEAAFARFLECGERMPLGELVERFYTALADVAADIEGHAHAEPANQN